LLQETSSAWGTLDKGIPSRRPLLSMPSKGLGTIRTFGTEFTIDDIGVFVLKVTFIFALKGATCENF
jgi:hypothetical protein